MKFHVKKGDEVVVLAGKEKGKRGKVISIAGKKQRVIVEGLQMIKRHTRKNQQNPQGAIVEREGTIHVSNLMKAEVFDARGSKPENANP
jgi:large subunit ribosomal protein L24